MHSPIVRAGTDQQSVGVDRGSLGMVVPIRNSTLGDSLSGAGHCHTGQPAVQLHHWADLSQYALCYEGDTSFMPLALKAQVQASIFTPCIPFQSLQVHDQLKCEKVSKPEQGRALGSLFAFVAVVLNAWSVDMLGLVITDTAVALCSGAYFFSSACSVLLGHSLCTSCSQRQRVFP